MGYYGMNSFSIYIHLYYRFVTGRYSHDNKLFFLIFRQLNIDAETKMEVSAQKWTRNKYHKLISIIIVFITVLYDFYASIKFFIRSTWMFAMAHGISRQRKKVKHFSQWIYEDTEIYYFFCLISWLRDIVSFKIHF